MFDGVPMVSSASPAGVVVVGPVPAPAMQNMCPKHWQWRSAERSSLFWRTEEHWKPGCMVSCRTAQGRKRYAKRQAKPAPDRAR